MFRALAIVLLAAGLAYAQADGILRGTLKKVDAE